MEVFEEIKRIRMMHFSGVLIKPIKLKVQRQGDAAVYYIYDRKCPLRKLLQDYCKMEGLAYTAMRFVYDGSGVPPNKCADDLGMENGDTIDVLVDQISG